MFFSAVKLGILTWESIGLTPAASLKRPVDELQFKSLPCWFQERESGRLPLAFNFNF